MFDNLSDRLSNSFKALQGKNKLSEANIKDAIREVRRSLLEADVALDVIKLFIERVQTKSIGLKVGEGLTPSQSFIKLVEQELTEIIGGENIALNLATQPPAVIMLAGLQGTGKTTSIAKLARYLKEREKKKILVVSADVYRPAAIKQLKVLAEQVGVDFFPSNQNDSPEKIVSRVPSQPILSHQIAQNIPDGWVDPEIVKQSKMLQQENLQTPLQALYKVNLNSMPALQVHFVQTATKKDLFYLLASLLFGSSALLFFIRRRFH